MVAITKNQLEATQNTLKKPYTAPILEYVDTQSETQGSRLGISTDAGFSTGS